MTHTRQRQLEAALSMAEKGNHQLNGTLQAFNLLFAAAAKMNGGKLEITAEAIDSVPGREIKIEKQADKVVIILVGEGEQEPEFDPGLPPGKFENPFIMEDETTLNGPQPADQPRIQTTDL